MAQGCQNNVPNINATACVARITHSNNAPGCPFGEFILTPFVALALLENSVLVTFSLPILAVLAKS
jgi:hypothetical protein